MARRPSEPVATGIDEITLEGKRVRVFNVDLPLEQVSLDPANPRIANTVEVAAFGEGPELQKRLETILWDDPDVHELYRQVLVNKGLVERVIVRQDGRVIEGNCRTVVYRRLRQNQPKEARWSHIPARVLPEDIAERDVAILLGEMHVAGKNTWSPFEKAGHVFRLHRDFALTQDEIAHRLRMSKSKVNQLIRAFDVMKNKFLRHYPLAANIRKFSYFEELYKKPQLREWLARDPKAEDLFVEWVGTGKLSQGLSVRELSAIIENDNSLRVLTERGFDEAKRMLELDDPAVTSRLFRRMKEMTEELEQARLDDIQRVRAGGNETAKRIVQDLNASLSRFIELCGVELPS